MSSNPEMVQIRIPMNKKQIAGLRRIADDRGTTLSVVVREAIDHIIYKERNDDYFNR